MASKATPQPIPGDATAQLCQLAIQLKDTMDLLPEHQRAIEAVTNRSIDQMEVNAKAIGQHSHILTVLLPKIESLTVAIRDLTAKLPG